MNMMNFLNSIMILSGIVVVLSEWLSKYTKLDGKWARLQSWVVSALIGVSATWLNVGVFSDMDWKGGLIMGIISALVANGIFSIEMVKKLLETIKVRNTK